jgi:hypothetical protein
VSREIVERVFLPSRGGARRGFGFHFLTLDTKPLPCPLLLGEGVHFPA